MYGPDQPSLTVGLRGIAYTEIEVFGPVQDVHSGLFGGIVHNPNQLLVNALAGLIDTEGHIAVPGFYEGVQPLSAREKSLYAALVVDDGGLLPHLGRDPRWRESKSTPSSKGAGPVPTLDINLLSGGSPRTSHSGHRSRCCLLPISARPKPRAYPSHSQRTHIRAPSARRHPRRVQKPALLTDLLLGPRPSPSRSRHLRLCARDSESNRYFTREGGSIPIVRRYCRRD